MIWFRDQKPYGTYNVSPPQQPDPGRGAARRVDHADNVIPLQKPDPGRGAAQWSEGEGVYYMYSYIKMSVLFSFLYIV